MERGNFIYDTKPFNQFLHLATLVVMFFDWIYFDKFKWCISLYSKHVEINFIIKTVANSCFCMGDKVMSELKHPVVGKILIVGHVCVDIIVECITYPEEDEKIGTNSKPNRYRLAI